MPSGIFILVASIAESSKATVWCLSICPMHGLIPLLHGNGCTVSEMMVGANKVQGRGQHILLLFWHLSLTADTLYLL